ncbi:MAG: hypothetical protein JO332_08660 [Planctomycetaceae bacterium]|nr:hypothetical protein [Planctomycetaceae bacterium]
MAARKRKAARKRELLAPRGKRRFVRRDPKGKFKESDDAGRSIAADRRQKAKRSVPKGQGDRGDQRRRSRRSKSSLFPALPALPIL